MNDFQMLDGHHGVDDMPAQSSKTTTANINHQEKTSREKGAKQKYPASLRDKEMGMGS